MRMTKRHHVGGSQQSVVGGNVQKQKKMNIKIIIDARANNCTDLHRVFEYYRYKVGSTLDAALATGILRNSITWYVSRLEKKGLLQVVCIKRDKTTGYMAKHYCADTRQWKCQVSRQLSLFENEKF